MLPPRFLPAPLEGVMHPAFCEAAARLRLVDGWLTPFWRVSQGVARTRYLQEFLAPFQWAGVPVWVQLMGVDAAAVAATAARFLELGAAGINLNFACPSRQVTGGGAGGGALRHPDRMLEIVSALRRELPEADLSLKLRTGWESPEEYRQWLPELLATGKPDWLALHFRTVKEQYAPVADAEARWRGFIESAAPVPVWINGDLANRVEAEKAMTTTGAAGAMAGRGWLRDPWWFRRGREDAPAPDEARRRFFAAATTATAPLTRGQTIELGKWLFRRILTEAELVKIREGNYIVPEAFSS